MVDEHSRVILYKVRVKHNGLGAVLSNGFFSSQTSTISKNYGNGVDASGEAYIYYSTLAYNQGLGWFIRQAVGSALLYTSVMAGDSSGAISTSPGSALTDNDCLSTFDNNQGNYTPACGIFGGEAATVVSEAGENELVASSPAIDVLEDDQRIYSSDFLTEAL